MGEKPSASTSALQLAGEHQNLLLHAIQDEKIALESRIHSFSRSFNAFAAKLLPHEATMLSENGGVVSVFPSTQRKLHTTRSWDFVGLPLDVSHRNSKAESDIIVAVLDTGIDITAPSFNDAGFGPPPAKWKGQCAMGVNFTGCNKKVIGARYYNLVENSVVDEPSPADTEGHGTHTSSTAGGGYVLGASLYGLAEGTARGGVPSARIAMYKVCWPGGCSDVDLLAAFDDAIADGVDIINISIGGPSVDFFRDPIAIGAFHAMKKGILTACSAGNSGPYIGTVQNVAPWIMTVAATSSDRQFRTGVVLGNGVKTSGISVNTFSPRKKMYPLTSGTLASTTSPYGNSSACDWGTLSSENVKGKIVYCLGSSGQDYTIYGLGGAGTIMALDVVTDIALTHLIPATFVSGKDATDINQYINSTRNPLAVILKSTTVPIQAPFVASFSSRGPQGVTRNILKPDIAAPGLDILAGYSKLVSVTGQQADKRYSGFNIISGTSMASPHAAGAAAYVRTFHPEWSPAAIKSALMTTATPMTVLQPDAELGSGAGQINPTKAVHPGLIYDISTNAYIRFLCKEGYNSTTIALITGGMQRYDCSSFKPALGTDGLNYPTMHTQLSSPNATITATFHRTVTNVGSDKSVYTANVVSPQGLEIEVVPRMLSFNELNEKKPFKVVLKGGPMPAGVHIYSALLEWSDSKHSVKSPIVVFKPLAPF
ncbi:unnamed protein product [Rhodiola kirilowii]